MKWFGIRRRTFRRAADAAFSLTVESSASNIEARALNRRCAMDGAGAHSSPSKKCGTAALGCVFSEVGVGLAGAI
jgi:hypothetical protein